MKLFGGELGIVKKVKADGRETFLTVDKVYFLGICIGYSKVYRDVEKALCDNNTHYSLHSAQQTIDAHLKSVERDKQERLNRKVVSSKFIKYP